MATGDRSNEEELLRGIYRFNAKILGLVLGLVFGLIIFIGTNWLLIKGGPLGPDGHRIVGPHLQLLGQFFIGYRVSFLGSIIGFFYGFALGTLCGAAIGWIYNKVVDLRTK